LVLYICEYIYLSHNNITQRNKILNILDALLLIVFLSTDCESSKKQ
jgi:hypothetical protein